MKTINNPLHYDFPSNLDSCAYEALGHMFSVDVPGMLYIMKLAKIRFPLGPTTIEIRRMLKILCAVKKKNFQYYRLTKKVRIREFIKKHRKGNYLLNMDDHVATLKNGMLIDSWGSDYWEVEGYWIIKNKYPRKKKEEYHKYSEYAYVA